MKIKTKALIRLRKPANMRPVYCLHHRQRAHTFPRPSPVITGKSWLCDVAFVFTINASRAVRLCDRRQLSAPV